MPILTPATTWTRTKSPPASAPSMMQTVTHHSANPESQHIAQNDSPYGIFSRGPSPEPGSNHRRPIHRRPIHRAPTPYAAVRVPDMPSPSDSVSSSQFKRAPTPYPHLYRDPTSSPNKENTASPATPSPIKDDTLSALRAREPSPTPLRSRAPPAPLMLEAYDDGAHAANAHEGIVPPPNTPVSVLFWSVARQALPSCLLILPSRNDGHKHAHVGPCI